jgi:hypothetical protein
MRIGVSGSGKCNFYRSSAIISFPADLTEGFSAQQDRFRSREDERGITIVVGSYVF